MGLKWLAVRLCDITVSNINCYRVDNVDLYRTIGLYDAKTGLEKAKYGKPCHPVDYFMTKGGVKSEVYNA